VFVGRRGLKCSRGKKVGDKLYIYCYRENSPSCLGNLSRCVQELYKIADIIVRRR
jgi:hypothetical protein